MNTVERMHIVVQPTVQHRARALAEVAIAYALLECALWSTGVWQIVWAVAMLAWVAVSARRSHYTFAELGVGKTGFRESLWIVPLTIIVSVGMVSGAWLAGSLHGLLGARTPLWHSLIYIVWSLVQEFLTMSFIFVRLEDAFAATRAIFFTAALFCLAHIPNLLLMAATLPMALGFCWFFRRFRNIYPIALSHALLGLTLSMTLSGALTHYMRVGAAYF
jgi:hypothetical protein